jgi:hypothetical protein
MNLATFLAGKGFVLPFQGHAGFSRVIEALTFQPDEREFFAVVVRMAARAIRLAAGTLVFACMITRVGAQPPLDFRVTLEALKAAVPGARPEVVTGSALRHALVLLVGA